MEHLYIPVQVVLYLVASLCHSSNFLRVQVVQCRGTARQVKLDYHTLLPTAEELM